MASLQELWERVVNTYDFGLFCLYMDILLDRDEILKIVSSLGLTYPGRRLSSIPTVELIDAFAEEFFENPEIGKEAIKILKKIVAPYGDVIAQLSRKEVREYLKSEIKKTTDIKKLTMLGFALILDDREELLKEFLWFADNAVKHKPAKEIDEKVLKEQKVRFDQMIKEKDEINKKLSEALRLSKEENEKLQKEIGELKKMNADLKSELTSLHAKKQETPGIPEVKHIEKSLEKILYFIEKIPQNENRLSAIPERVETIILRSLDEIKKISAETAINEEKRFSNLRQSLFEELKKFSSPKIQPKEEAKKTPLERIALFVDAENLYYSARECFRGKINYGKLLSLIMGQNRYLVKAYAYVVRSLDKDPTPFITSLEKLGLEVKVKEPKYRSDGSAKANWDMGIALDILTLLDKIDTIILASGDGDFVPLVNYIKSKGKTVEVFSFPKNTAYDLIDVADKFYPLDEKIALM